MRQVDILPDAEEGHHVLNASIRVEALKGMLDPRHSAVVSHGIGWGGVLV